MKELIFPLIGIWVIWIGVALWENQTAKHGIIRTFTFVFGVPVWGITLLIAITEIARSI